MKRERHFGLLLVRYLKVSSFQIIKNQLITLFSYFRVHAAICSDYSIGNNLC